MKKVVIKKDSNTGERKEAFLGAIIGAVTGIAGSIISGKKKKRAEEQAFKLAQEEQNRIDGIQQGQAMTSQYANQDYVDQYLNKVTLKNGGKVKVKQSKKGDRIAYANKYKAGGRKKGAFGSLIGKDGIGGEVAGAVGGITGLASSIISKPTVTKQVKKADGFNYGVPKTSLVPNSYQTDVNGNPITPINSMPSPMNTTLNPTLAIDTPIVDPLNPNSTGIAKMGKRKVIKST